MKKVLVFTSLLLLIASLVSGQIADDRRVAPVVLDTLNERSFVKVAGYQAVSCVFTSNSSFLGTVKPVFSFDNGATFVTSDAFRLVGIDGGTQVSLTNEFVVGTFAATPGATSPTHGGCQVTAYTSGSVTGQAQALFMRPWSTLLMINGASPWDLTLGGLKMITQNAQESAGKSGPSSIDSFTHCTGQFNELLDANETRHLTTLPSGGQFARICWAVVTLDGSATGAANFELIDGTTTTNPCDSSTPLSIMGPWNLQHPNLSGFRLGGPNGPILASAAARRLCAKSTNATSTNKIQVVGTYATY